MIENRPLFMRRDMEKPLARLQTLPELFDVVKDDGTRAGAWEWIMAGACPMCKSSYAETSSLAQIFFISEYSQPSGTVAVFMKDGRAYLDLLAVHPFARGMGFGRHVINGALEYIREQGVQEACVRIDEECTAAIGEFLDTGFEPDTENAEDAARWERVRVRIRENKVPKPERIRLWNDGEIPFFQEGNCIPCIEAYPVEGARGAVVICPGGAYCLRASHEGRQIARMLNEAGVSTYVLEYRVRPCHYEAPLADAKRAIRTLRAMGYEKVGVMGFSAGGHLTCSAATLYDAGDANSPDPVERLSSRPDAFLPCYPVVSFVSFRHQGSMMALLGEHAGSLQLQKRFSAELNVTGDTPPAFIWHTVTDRSVPVENSLNLASALTHAGVLFEMHLYPQGEHGLGLAGGNPVIGGWSAQCQRWLLEMGFGRQGDRT